jgi:hypothetical protein
MKTETAITAHASVEDKRNTVTLNEGQGRVP